jgi:hypothetical protein
MTRQPLLDDPAGALPDLGQLLAAYFHEDWPLGGRGWEGVLSDYLAESSPAAVVRTGSQLDTLLAAGLGDTELESVLERLGGSVDPGGLGQRPGEWLLAVRARLAAGAA